LTKADMRAFLQDRLDHQEFRRVRGGCDSPRSRIQSIGSGCLVRLEPWLVTGRPLLVLSIVLR